MDIIKVGIFRCRSGFDGNSAAQREAGIQYVFKHGSLYLHFYLYYHKGSDRVGICGEVRGDDRH